MNNKILLSITSIGGLLALSASAQASNYTITDLGTLYGGNPDLSERSGAFHYSEGNGINASGQVVGGSGNSFDGIGFKPQHGFIYSNGVMSDLGTLGGDYSSSSARGINASGHIVGESDTSSGDRHAFMYSNGVMTDLGTLGLGGDYSYSRAAGINDSGQVIGDSGSPYSEQHAFMYSNGAMTDLGTLGGMYSYAYGINASGQVVGVSETSDSMHAFIYSNGAMTDLGTSGWHSSEAYGINDSGQVVGSLYESSGEQRHAFMFSNGVMTDIGALDGVYSEAYGINASGQVVGYANVWSNQDQDGNQYLEYHAFIYSNGVMTDLNTLIAADSGWTLESATGINDNGQIIANGWNIELGRRALILTPQLAAVPVPGAVWLFGSALMGFFYIDKRHKQALA